MRGRRAAFAGQLPVRVEGARAITTNRHRQPSLERLAPLFMASRTVHVLLVRAKGVVPPIDAFNHELGERK